MILINKYQELLLIIINISFLHSFSIFEPETIEENDFEVAMEFSTIGMICSFSDYPGYQRNCFF